MVAATHARPTAGSAHVAHNPRDQFPRETEYRDGLAIDVGLARQITAERYDRDLWEVCDRRPGMRAVVAEGLGRAAAYRRARAFAAQVCRT